MLLDLVVIFVVAEFSLHFLRELDHCSFEGAATCVNLLGSIGGAIRTDFSHLFREISGTFPRRGREPEDLLGVSSFVSTDSSAVRGDHVDFPFKTVIKMLGFVGTLKDGVVIKKVVCFETVLESAILHRTSFWTLSV